MKWISATVLVILMLAFGMRSNGQDYSQQYRPQFHFSPASGWIGDPDGTIKFNGNYHLFWWGHAISKDLVYWKEYTWPMMGGNSSFDYYSGSVVVDTAHTSGFGNTGDTVAVAIYTMHNKSTGIESQGISSSTDTDFKYFNYYNSNPIISSSSNDFRDPQVFWDKQRNRWAMVIARPGQRKIEIYSSTDLKNWTYQSSFGPLGAQQGAWEVPDLFQLPLDGNSGNKKWVMTCNMGPNKAQYWVGNFDGTEFLPDETTLGYLEHGIGLPGDVFEDFEQANYNSWTVEGTAFSTTPANGTLPGQMNVSGYLGDYLVNSFNDGDASTGKLTSKKFVIGKKFINFLIAGGNHPGNTCINLIVNDAVVKTATGDNSEQLKWFGWDVTAFKGDTAKIEIVDNSTGSWGHINIDQIMFSDILMDQLYEQAYWIDYGPDFYAVKTYRNYDNDENRTVWLGWMNNWEYANSIPTSWGGSTGESIPREIELVSSGQGYKIRQTPIPELQKLRKDEISFTDKTVDGTVNLNEFSPQKNTYEFEATYVITPGSNQKVGFNLCVYADKMLTLGYDEKTSNVYLDRTNSGYVSFNSNFPKVMTAPIQLTSNEIKFHVFVDQLSVEVFVNDGDVVLTSLMFPNPNYQKGFQVFSKNAPSKLKEFHAWELKSIWENNTTGFKEKKTIDDSGIKIYPNPPRNRLTVQTSTKQTRNLVIKIFDLQGQEQFAKIDSKVLSDQVSLNISRLKQGYYMLVVTDGQQTFGQPFLKIE